MQPNLLSPEREENQSTSLDLQEITQPHLSFPTETTQLASVPAEDNTPQPSLITEKKHSKLNIPAMILGILVFILLVAVMGLGYWAYTLRTELMATQQHLTALQGEHNNLQTDYTTLASEKERLNTELAQSKAELEKANTDLATTQANLKKSQSQNENLHTQIDKASKLVEVLYAWTTSDEPSDVFKIDSLVKKVNDQQLITRWDDLTRSPTQEAFGKFFSFLIDYIRFTLK